MKQLALFVTQSFLCTSTGILGLVQALLARENLKLLEMSELHHPLIAKASNLRAMASNLLLIAT